MRSIPIFLLAILVWSTPLLACVSPTDETRYRVEHEIFGTIGQETLTLHCQGDQLVVERTVDITVRVFFVTAYHRDARYTEVWQDGRLIRFESHTNDNGEQTTFVARAEASGGIIIDGPDGQIEVPHTAIPTDPWNQSIVDRALLFDRTDGHLMHVNITDAGRETIQVDERLIATRKFVVSGKREQELWFGPNGMWLRSRILHDSGVITITRQS